MSLREQLEQNNYVIIDDFINPIRAEKLYDDFKQFAFEYPEYFKRDIQCPMSLAIYDHQPFLEILVEKCNFMSEVMGEPMLPTYSYSRLYAKNDELKIHKDRNSCETSVTLHLGGDKSWPIWFTKPDGETVSLDMKPGQAVIYLGMISEHWRTKYKGTKYGQVFLHYVRSRGPNANFYFDKANSRYRP